MVPMSALHTLTSDHVISLFSMEPSDVYLDNGRTDDYIAAKNVKKILDDLAELESKVAACLEEQGLCGSDYVKLQELCEQKEEREAELLELYDKWETVSAQLEEARG